MRVRFDLMKCVADTRHVGRFHLIRFCLFCLAEDNTLLQADSQTFPKALVISYMRHQSSPGEEKFVTD